MRDWLTLFDTQYAGAILWTLAALIALLVILFVVRLLRRVGHGAFSSTGRNRPRLGVTDSVAVDNQRRLVLVRRDDVEHLILIGGPGDVVVEQNIRPGAVRPRVPQPDPALNEEPAPAPRAPEPPVNSRQDPVLLAENTSATPVVGHATPETTVSSAPLERQNGPSPERTLAAQQGHSASQPSSRSTGTMPPPVAPATPSAVTSDHGSSAGPMAASTSPSERSAEETRRTNTDGQHGAAGGQQSRSQIDDEMSKLLEDVSDERR